MPQFQLKPVDKARYRKHLNIVIVGCIFMLAAGSLLVAQILIGLFPNPEGSHFHWNLAGVVVSAIAIVVTLNHYRTHSFMEEVTYVWELKQILNRIQRKLGKLEAAAKQGDIDALNAIQFSYSGSRLLWSLDDNTIVMDELAVHQLELDALADKFNVTLSTDTFSVGVLDNY